MNHKKNYSEEEIKQILEKTKPETIIDPEERLKKLENDFKVVFLAVSQLKSEIDKINLKMGKAKPSLKAEEFRKYSEAEATNLIREYVSRNPGCLTSEIISNLKIHPDKALKALQILKEEKKVRSEEIGKGK
jgi:predicted transcriptional regulator